MIDELLAKVRAGESEAALTLGLLLERAARRPYDDVDDIVEMLAPEYADIVLTDAQAGAAIDGLAAYVQEETLPQPMAVWALSKCGDERAAGAARRARAHRREPRSHLRAPRLPGADGRHPVRRR